MRSRLAPGAVVFAGAMLTTVVLPYQAYELTGSTIGVGMLSAAEVVPVVALALAAGAAADALEPRRALALAQVGALAAGAALVVNALLDRPHAWILYVAAFLAAASVTLLRPWLQELLPAGTHAGRVAGSAVGGLLIVAFGVAAAYAVDCAALVLGIAALALLGGRVAARARSAAPVRALEHVRERPEAGGAWLVDWLAMGLFGTPAALYPSVAERFGGAGTLGLIAAAPAAGALLALVLAPRVAAARRLGRGLAVAAVAWGLGVIAFGVAGALWLAVAVLVLAGVAEGAGRMLRAALWLQTIPPELRGRLAGAEMVAWSTGPALGNVEGGLVGSVAGVRAAIASGGALCVLATGAIVAAVPRLWRYRAGAG